MDDTLALREFLDENLNLVFTRPLSPPRCRWPRSQQITKRDRYPLALISDLLDRLRFAHGAYNLVHIAVSDHCTLKKHSLRVRGFNPISGDIRSTHFEEHSYLLAWAAPIVAPIDCVNSKYIGFGVEEFFDPLDLQAPVFVGDDVRNG
jgi:hypothetical protein